MYLSRLCENNIWYLLLKFISLYFDNKFYKHQIGVTYYLQFTFKRQKLDMTSFGHKLHTYKFKIRFRILRYIGPTQVRRFEVDRCIEFYKNS